jgi:flagellar motility protein MotE (MotC chaperone)
MEGDKESKENPELDDLMKQLLHNTVGQLNLQKQKQRDIAHREQDIAHREQVLKQEKQQLEVEKAEIANKISVLKGLLEPFHKSSSIVP